MTRTDTNATAYLQCQRRDHIGITLTHCYRGRRRALSIREFVLRARSQRTLNRNWLSRCPVRTRSRENIEKPPLLRIPESRARNLECEIKVVAVQRNVKTRVNATVYAQITRPL